MKSQMDWTYSQKYCKICTNLQRINEFLGRKIPNYAYNLHYEDLVKDQEKYQKKF